jgi:alpha-D-ribose 1-methylphosphonate 5-triphosphate diphosphatase
MSASERIFTNAAIILSDQVVNGTLAVRNGLIAAIDDSPSSVRPGAIDCGGDLLIPGLVELHTDNMERHLVPRPGATWPVLSAIVNHDREMAASGITTVLNAICVGEVHSRSVRLGALQEMREALDHHIGAASLKADHYLHWRCEVSYGGLTELLAPLMDHSRLRLISVMDHTPGQRQFVQLSRYAEYYKGQFGMSDAELESLIAQRRRDQEEFSAGNRTAVIGMARSSGIPVASHDDATLAHVEEAIHDGVSIAEFPTTFEAAEASHKAGMAVLMGGPNIVRGQSHSGNVSARDLAEHGLLDVISSDYVPSSQLLGALLLEAAVEAITLPEAIAMITRNPARAAGFTDRGEIKPGLRADLVRVCHAGALPVIRDVWAKGERIA